MTETIFIKIKKTSEKNWKKLNSAKCENGPGACENSEVFKCLSRSFLYDLDVFSARYIRKSPKGKTNCIFGPVRPRPVSGDRRQFHLPGMNENQLCHSYSFREALSGRE